VIGLVWFYLVQRRPERPYTVLPPGAPEAAGAAEASPDEAGTDEAGAGEPGTGEPIADEAVAERDAADGPGADKPGPPPAAAGEMDDAGITATRSEDLAASAGG
jgi:hypothetical protein